MNHIISSRLLTIGLLAFLFVLSCTEEQIVKDKNYTGPLFTSLTPAQTKMEFRNSITETNEFNFLNYLNIYNGGGVALGDINNDGLLDVYLTSNQKSNKLYLNQGDMTFKDITFASGTKDDDGWSNGVSFIDINNDGWLDIYVCKSGALNNPVLRKNKLFVNQKNNEFVEQAADYGLDISTFSTQAYFLDYDKDGDQDMYLVSHRTDFDNTIVMSSEIQKAFVPDFSDKFYRNDGQRFTDVSNETGINNKTWGHSASIYDFNGDGWLDIFVCNDFLEPDHLWINNQNGGFKDEVLKYMDHISFYSMGSDVADINNDGLFDLMVLDMVPEDHVRSKQNMPSMSTAQFHTIVNFGYHHQYMANMLQLNQGNGAYSEISHLAGISKTDWSWAPLFADFDNDGIRDLFITNGIKHDMTDNDYKNNLNERSASGPMTLDEVFQLTHSVKLKNYMFHNKGNATFENKTDDWGFTEALNSNGAAYGDLDNDGDLDLVINNLEDFASVYQNNDHHNFLKVTLKGSANNRLGLGAKITLQSGEQTQYYQHFLNRGYLSSVSNVPVFGLGDDEVVNSLQITWPDGKFQELSNLPVNQTIELDYTKASGIATPPIAASNLMAEVSPETLGVQYRHSENDYDDFSTEILLPYKYSTMGPRITTGDVNGDGKTDFYLSGAEGMAGKLFVQNTNNQQFTESNAPLWEKDKMYEDVNALFFDADGDKDLDLYVVSGGNEQSRSAALFQDRLYLNDGKGQFKKATNSLPRSQQSGSVVLAEDFDKDGDLDLFIGGRIVPGKYPIPASSVLLQNDKGRFTDVTKAKAKELQELGLVTSATFSDYDNDGDRDLLVVGEWMPLTIFENNNNTFSKKEDTEATGIGWWYNINAADIDGDGDEDYVLGNLGLNNKYGAKKDKPFHVFCDDFDNTGNLDIVLSKESKTGDLLPMRGRECSSQQMPFIKEKFPTFKSFAEADLKNIYGEDKLSGALHYQATNFESIILINDGKGNFETRSMPMAAQYGPTLQTILLDINKDGHIDIVGAGNIYDTEVETVRFDGSKGYVLLGDGQGNFNPSVNSGFALDGNVKDIALLEINGQSIIMVVKNNDAMQLFEIKS